MNLHDSKPNSLIHQAARLPEAAGLLWEPIIRVCSGKRAVHLCPVPMSSSFVVSIDVVVSILTKPDNGTSLENHIL